MTDNLLQMILDTLRGPLGQRLMATIGLDPSTSAKALEGTSATVLSGLALKAQKPGGGEAITDILKKGEINGSLLDNLGDVLNSPEKTEEVSRRGGGLVEAIFGPQAAMITDLLGKVLNIGSGALGKLLPLLVPIILSQISKVATSKGLDSGGLADLLKNQLPMLKGALPPGLEGVLGIGNLSPASASTAVSHAPILGPADAAPPVNAPPVASSLNKALPWLALLALAVAAVFILPRACSPTGEEPVRDGVVEPNAAAPGAPAVGSGESEEAPAAPPAMTTLVLPGDVTLEVPAGSVFENLANHLKASDADPARVFTMTELAFAQDSTEPTSTREPFEVDQIVGWLATLFKAYPEAQIKVIGVRQSEPATIAEALKARLVERGVEADRLAVEGETQRTPQLPDAPEPVGYIKFNITKP